MFISKEIKNELKKRFPLVYGVYRPVKGEKVFIFYEGKENKKRKEEIEKFLKEKISSPIQPCFIFSEKKMIVDQASSIIYT